MANLVLKLLVLSLFCVLAMAATTQMNYSNVPTNSITKKSGTCPIPKTLHGDCTFQASVNCLSDDTCPGAQKCCREGCNKICKDPMAVSAPNIDLNNLAEISSALKRWKTDKMKEWNTWADGTRKVMLDRLAELWQIAAPSNQ